mmetsp:Transcript_8503/g.14585  ORF Transcript_8503/g.14585 Transcript_8503/m.14585 type:complete len:399 (+) Transcript_8503:34-1230(+)
MVPKELDDGSRPGTYLALIPRAHWWRRSNSGAVQDALEPFSSSNPDSLVEDPLSLEASIVDKTPSSPSQLRHQPASSDQPATPSGDRQNRQDGYSVARPGGGVTVRPGVGAVPGLESPCFYYDQKCQRMLLFCGHLSNAAELAATYFHKGHVPAQEIATQFLRENLEPSELSDSEDEEEQLNQQTELPSPTLQALLGMHAHFDTKELCVDMLTELQGTFAFVLMDVGSKSGRVLAARDPTGKEKLYYGEDEGGSLMLTNNLEDLPARALHEVHWQLLLPGSYLHGHAGDFQVAQFALTMEQLAYRRVSLEHLGAYVGEPQELSRYPLSPKKSSNLLDKLSGSIDKLGEGLERLGGSLKRVVNATIHPDESQAKKETGSQGSGDALHVCQLAAPQSSHV